MAGAVIVVIAGFSISAPAATVQGYLRDFTATGYSPQVTFVPLSTPLAYRSTNTILDVTRRITTTNGFFSINMVGGLYRTEFVAPNNSILILVPPDDPGTYNFNTVANLATNVGTFSFTNKWGAITSRVLLGTNVAFLTNNFGAVNESLTVSATSSGGGTTYTNDTGLPGVVNGSAIGTNLSTLATPVLVTTMIGTNAFWKFPLTPVPTTNVTTAAALIAAVNTAPSGATVGIQPGTYDLGTNQLAIPDGVNVVGVGSELVNLTGYADCWGVESFGAPSGGPQVHPGNNSIVQGFTLTCDTNKLLAAFNAGTNSGMWSGLGVSSKNPPANTGFTNVLVRDVKVMKGWWDGFHFNPSNRTEVRLEYCWVESEGLNYSVESGTGSNTNCVYVFDHCVGISRGRIPAAIQAGVAYTYPAFISADCLVTMNNCWGFVSTNGGPAGQLPAMLQRSGNGILLKLSNSEFWSEIPGDNTHSNAVGNFVFNTTNYFKSYGDGRGLTNHIHLAPGSNVTITTNSATSFTIASAGGTGMLTNQFTTNAVGSAIVGAVSFAGNITNGVLTASQFVATDANKALVSTLNATSLTNLNASELRSGTVPNARLTGTSQTNITLYGDVAISASAWSIAGDGQAGLGIVTATSFSGDGSDLTNLNASELASGTVAAARLPATATTNNGNFTTSLLVGISAGRGVTNTGVGAQPIDGDGTPATAVQVQALFPSTIQTNGQTTGYTNTGNIQAATLNTTGAGTLAGRLTANDARLTADLWIGNTKVNFSSASTGVLMLQNNAGTGFSRLQLGLTTAAAPSLKVSGGNLELSDGPGTGTTNSFIVPNTITATNGFASRATAATIAIEPTGWTNSYTVNAVVDFDATTGMSWYIKNNAGTGVYTNTAALSTHAEAILQPGGALVITGGTSPSGTARQF